MGFLDSIFGGSDYGAGKYGGQADGYQHQSDMSTGAVNGQISQYGDIAGGGRSTYNKYNPQWGQATDARLAYDQQDPNTQQSRDTYLANRVGATTSAYNATRAHMAQSAYSRGLDTPSSAGASSVYAGNDAYAQNNRLNEVNAGNTGYGDWAEAEKVRRMNDATAVTGAARDQGLQQWDSGLGSQAAGNEWMANKYSADGQNYRQLQQQAQQRQQADQGQLLQLIGGVGAIAGGGGFGGAGARVAGIAPGGDGGGSQANWFDTPAAPNPLQSFMTTPGSAPAAASPSHGDVLSLFNNYGYAPTSPSWQSANYDFNALSGRKDW